MITTIFFDFDGVIVESVDIKTKAFYQLFEIEGEDVARRVVDYHLKNAGVSRYDKFRHIYREILRRPLNEEEFSILCNRFAGLVVENVVSAPYVKGAEEFLENYATDYKCFIVSATPQEEIEEIIHRRRISRFFKAVYGAPTKKNDAVKDSLTRETTNSCDAAYVGDAMSDYLAAKENGVAFIARVTNDNNSLFEGLDCIKLNNLVNLRDTIISISRQKENNIG